MFDDLIFIAILKIKSQIKSPFFNGISKISKLSKNDLKSDFVKSSIKSLNTLHVIHVKLWHSCASGSSKKTQCQTSHGHPQIERITQHDMPFHTSPNAKQVMGVTYPNASRANITWVCGSNGNRHKKKSIFHIWWLFLLVNVDAVRINWSERERQEHF
jgi:hypothetical protein